MADQVAHHSRASNWFRSPYFQTFIIGACAFTAPGVWGAITSTGAGGTLDTVLVNSVCAFSTALTATFAFAGPWVANLVGFRWAMVIATYGYPFYSAGLLYNQKTGKSWLLWFGTVLCGTSGGIFWAVEPAVFLGYAEPKNRGKHVAIWIVLSNLGGITTGAINLAFNAKSEYRGSLSIVTYVVLIAIAASGPFWALLLSNPSQVRRSDGTPVEYTKQKLSVRFEAKEFWRLAKKPALYMLFPLSFYVWLAQSYVGTFLALYFSVRARAMGSFAGALLGMLFGVLHGYWLDHPRFSIAFRARALFVFISVLGSVAWIWLMVLQSRYQKTNPTIDWNSPGFAAGFTPYLIQSALSAGILTGFVPWIIAELTESHDDLFRAATVARGVSGYGSCLGYGIGAAKSLSPLGYAGILAAIFFAGIPSAAWSVWKVGVGRKPIQPEDPEQLFQNATVAVLGGAPHHASEKTSIEEKAASDEKLA